jgi:hypothetical protein
MLSSLDSGLDHVIALLVKVRAHELLEVEVTQHIVSAEVEELLELGVGVDLATVVLVLKLVLLDISSDLLGHIGPGHLNALIHTKEGGELVANASGLHEPARGTVTHLALALGGLLRLLNLTHPLLLESAILCLDCGKHRSQLLELGEKYGRHFHEVTLFWLLLLFNLGGVRDCCLDNRSGSGGGGGGGGGGGDCLFDHLLRGLGGGRSCLLGLGGCCCRGLLRWHYNLLTRILSK